MPAGYQDTFFPCRLLPDLPCRVRDPSSWNSSSIYKPIILMPFPDLLGLLPFFFPFYFPGHISVQTRSAC